MSSKYLPQTQADVEACLKAIGLSSIAELFATIPQAYRLELPLELPEALSEPEVRQLVTDLSLQNKTGPGLLSFVGAGAYAHAAPSAVDALIQRGEFLTAYTPYQPEVSQGTLQAIFEYQSMLCNLLEMDVANASNYDGSTAVAEAALMAERVTGKKTIAYSEGLHPEYIAVLKTYVHPRGFELVPVPLAVGGVLDVREVEKRLAACNPAAFIVQYPNAFGGFEEMEAIGKVVHVCNGLFVSATADMTSYGLLTPPGAFGADIAVGEGQGFGLPLSFGGPYLGVFATRKAHLRAMPGRLVGRSLDRDGKVAYTLTLSTREQHIRREKATSNICTNQGLCALAVTIYLGLLGKEGIRDVAEQSTRRAHGLAKMLVDAGCGKLAYSAPFFHEFVLDLGKPARDVVRLLSEEGIVPGLDLGRWNSDWQNRLLINATELHSEKDCKRLVTALKTIR